MKNWTRNLLFCTAHRKLPRLFCTANENSSMHIYFLYNVNISLFTINNVTLISTKTGRLTGPCKFHRNGSLQILPTSAPLLSLWCIFWIFWSFGKRLQFIIGNSWVKFKLVACKYDTNVSVKIDFTRLWTSKPIHAITSTVPLLLLLHFWFWFSPWDWNVK